MKSDNYPLLKRTLRLDVAASWLLEDVKDDFFPDPNLYREIGKKPSEYLKEREHRILQFEGIATVLGTVPKRSGLIREAIWLPPTHRLLYLAVLHHFLPRLDARLSSACYSYRRENQQDEDDYPFPGRAERWLEFQNGFREAATQGGVGALLLADIASFYDHIPCKWLIERITSLLGATVGEADAVVLQLLGALLLNWAPDGFGIPQNYDPSSFFGSMYLHPIDQDMLAGGYRCYRWVDDIRVVAKSKKEAIEALQHLQRSLAKYRLFVASDKTRIVTPDDPEWQRSLDVSDDVQLSEAERLFTIGDKAALETLKPLLQVGLRRHAAPGGDDRKFRAFGNKMLELKSFEEFSSEVGDELRGFTIPRLETNPDRSDYWARFLVGDSSEPTRQSLKRLLIDDRSPFEWQRVHLWRVATSLPVGAIGELVAVAEGLRPGSETELVLAQAIVFIGRHGENLQRERTFTRFLGNSSMPIQRAIAMAIQELPREQREGLYRRLVAKHPEQKELAEYLLTLGEPDYGVRPRASRQCREVAKPVVEGLRRGVGLMEGKRVSFVFSRRDYDYE